MDPKKELTLEQIREIFSHNGEYSFTQDGNTIEITYDGHSPTSRPYSTLIYKPTIQTLIRNIESLHFLVGYESRG